VNCGTCIWYVIVMIVNISNGERVTQKTTSLIWWFSVQKLPAQSSCRQCDRNKISLFYSFYHGFIDYKFLFESSGLVNAYATTPTAITIILGRKYKNVILNERKQEQQQKIPIVRKLRFSSLNRIKFWKIDREFVSMNRNVCSAVSMWRQITSSRHFLFSRTNVLLS